MWRRGSVIESWLLGLTAAAALFRSPAWMGSPGIGLRRGPVDLQRGDRRVRPAAVLTTAQYSRFGSRSLGSFAGKALPAMCKGFGRDDGKKS